MKPPSMTKALLTQLRPIIDEALVAVAKKHGVTLKLGNGSYDPEAGTAKMQLLIAVVDKNGEAKDPLVAKAEAQFRRFALAYGLQPEWLGKTAQRHNGESMTILGLMPTRSKFPVLCAIGGESKRLLLTTNEVISRFNKEAS